VKGVGPFKRPQTRANARVWRKEVVMSQDKKWVFTNPHQQINCKRLGKAVIIDGPNSYELFLEGLTCDKSLQFVFKFNSGKIMKVNASVCGILNNPIEILGIHKKNGIIIEHEIVLALSETIFDELKVPVIGGTCSYVLFRGRYASEARKGEGEYLLFHTGNRYGKNIKTSFSLTFQR
jgi:hypothetical protein